MSDNPDRLAVIIMARDEAPVIARAVSSVRAALDPGDRLIVVADHCTDQTADLAENAGAQVLRRTAGKASGKGAALAWLIDNHAGTLLSFALILVLDADNWIEPDCLPRLRRIFPPTSRAGQIFVSPVAQTTSGVGRLAALSELVDQQIGDRIRAALGWSVRLRGTGMVFRPGLLIRYSSRLDSQVEDIALTLLLAADGVKITRIGDAQIYDPKPGSLALASRQRARWFRGQWQALWRYRRAVLRIIRQGPAGWSLLGSIFLRPKLLLLSLLLLGALAAAAWPPLARFLWALFALYAGGYALGVLLLPERKAILGALLHLPAFAWMWLRSILLSMRNSGWLRSRS